jgi:NAD(P)-dependent dehydrogenase (short-subunit alcohol dehydrogenase family)
MLEGKIVVITGGAGALGSLFCHAIALNGGVAVVADYDVGKATEVVEKINSLHPGCAEAAQLDITSPASVASLIEAVHERHGVIDAVVNSAYPRNKNYGRILEDVTYADFCENVSTHLGGYFLVSQQCSIYFRQQGHGNIVNISSIYGTMTPRFDVYAGLSMTMPVEYAAAKSGLLHITRYFAQYFKKDGVRVNAISPGGILEGQPDEFLERYKGYCGGKGMLEAKDIVGTLLFLLSDDSRYLTGQNLVVDDGYSL